MPRKKIVAHESGNYYVGPPNPADPPTKKVLPLEEKGKVTGYMIFCPACKCGHLFNTVEDVDNGVGGKKPVWNYNGNAKAPTFHPSMLVKCNSPDHPHYQPRTQSSVCHSFVEDGKIRFLDDCTHELKGKTVDLPDFDGTKWR